jgi:hypothetical protein
MLRHLGHPELLMKRNIQNISFEKETKQFWVVVFLKSKIKCK